MVSSWPIKNVNIYLLFNAHSKQIIKVIHTSQASSFSLHVLEYFTEIGKYSKVTFLVLLTNSFFFNF